VALQNVREKTLYNEPGPSRSDDKEGSDPPESLKRGESTPEGNRLQEFYKFYIGFILSL
jgi:hypothetical protein